MPVSKEEFENMIHWNLPGVIISEVEQHCQTYEWFAIIMYLGQDGEAGYREGEFILHYGMDPYVYISVTL